MLELTLLSGAISGHIGVVDESLREGFDLCQKHLRWCHHLIKEYLEQLTADEQRCLEYLFDERLLAARIYDGELIIGLRVQDITVMELERSDLPGIIFLFARWGKLGLYALYTYTTDVECFFGSAKEYQDALSYLKERSADRVLELCLGQHPA